jgi:glycosyltransferase involved in cell wall biosynthesis
VYVVPEPTPYRSPLLDRIAELGELDLFVVYAAESVQGRSWSVEQQHPHHVLSARRRVPGASRLLHHDYPIDATVWRLLEQRRPDCVVIAGWSTFASQAALLWSARRGVPYVLTLESHALEPRRAWKRIVRRVALRPVLQRASRVLAAGSLARAHAIELGASPDRVAIFANTIDVDAFTAAVDGARGRRDLIRARHGAAPDDVVVLTVARRVPEKGLDVLDRALPGGVQWWLAGDGALQPQHAVLLGQLDRDGLVEAYAAADVFALPSRHEPWGVVVNEAAAAALPLVLSDRVGAAADLLRDGENGALVPAGDAEALRAALATLATDPSRRAAYGRSSRALVGDWGYDTMTARFVDAVRAAARS